MSIPFSSCLVAKAANGNKKQYEELCYVVSVNVQHGGFTKRECDCKKRCHASRAKRLKLLDRLIADFGIFDLKISKAKQLRVKRFIASMLEVDKGEPAAIALM